MKTTINYYRFNIEDPQQKAEYKHLSTKCRLMGLEKFTSYPSDRDWFKKIKAVAEKGDFELETKYLFENQWNGESLRVFDWSEAIYPNRNIKEGYYLDQTEEMIEIRATSYKCHYCARHYRENEIPEDGKCHKCRSCEYPPKPEHEEFLILKPIKPR